MTKRARKSTKKTTAKVAKAKRVVRRGISKPKLRKRVVRLRRTRRVSEPPPIKIEPEVTNHGEQIIEGTKYELGLHKPSAFRAHNLPFEYGLTKIVLLVVDPGFIFTYWEVEPRRIEEALEKIGYNSRLTLRFCEPTRSFDVEVFERTGNWYLRLNRPEELLTVEIGMKNERGEFFKLASSNTMKLPPQGLAVPGPIRWMVVSPDGEKVVTEVEEYTEADLELLKKIMGPYFFELLRRGKFASLTTSSLAGVFTEISSIKG